MAFKVFQNKVAVTQHIAQIICQGLHVNKSILTDC